MTQNKWMGFAVFAVCLISQSGFSNGIFPPKPRPTPGPTAAPTPRPSPNPGCSNAGPVVGRDLDEYAVTFQANNGKFVVAECGGDDVGEVLANRANAGEWETFYLRLLTGGSVSIRTSHGRYLSAELGGGSDIHANRRTFGSWESFQLIGSLTEGAHVLLKTSNDQNFVSARVDQNPPVVNARVTAMGPWEQFKVHLIAAPYPDPKTYSNSQLRDFQGDLMLWVPAVKPNFVNGEDPVSHIRRVGDQGAVARGIEAGWVWSLSVSRYPKDQREIIYKAALDQGYTHFAVQVTHCTADNGYHGLFPTSAADCSVYDDKLNTILRELWAHKLIPICAGVSPADGVAPGLDRSLCRVVMNDWDNSDQADCRIKILAETFPEALIMFELPESSVTPSKDSCSPSPFPTNGGDWIRKVQQKYPNFFAVGYEVNQPNGMDKNVAQLNRAHPWWRDVQEIRFETDTYWKFWSNLDFNTQKKYNDDLQARAPWLSGFMSGGTTHAPPVNGGSHTGGFLGEIDIGQVSLKNISADFAQWPITTHITKIELRYTGVHIELDNGRPFIWPDTPDRPEMGPLLYTIGMIEKINGVWYGSAPIQLWRGLHENGGGIQIQNINDGTNRGQIQSNWFYDSRWGVLAGYQPKPGETIGLFVCAGDCRDANPLTSPIHERSNIVLISLPKANEEIVLQP